MDPGNQPVEKFTNSSDPPLTGDYTKFSYDWGASPDKNATWNWSDLNDTQAGVYSEATGTFTGEIRVTQLYVEILGPRITFDVKAENVMDVWEYGFLLTYDTTWLTATGFVSRGLPPQDRFTKAWPLAPRAINDTAGYVTLDYSLPTDVTVGLSGNVTCATIVFLVDGFGRSELDFTMTRLVDSDGFDIPHEVYDGYFRNTLLGDIAGPASPDGTVDGLDLSMMGDGFGSSPEDPNWVWIWPDYKHDEIADVYDLWALGKDYGKSVPS